MNEKYFSEERVRQSNFRYEFSSWRPGGNDTALVYANISETNLRKQINDDVMKIYPNIEQVGFVYIDQNGMLNLQMAGGEFCGNATRSTAYLALQGKPGNISIKVSGVNDPLNAGVTENGEAFAQMPVYENLSKVVPDPDRNAWIVSMEGITHYVTFDEKFNDLSNPDEVKRKGMQILKQKGLDSLSASGVIFTTQQGNKWKIDPVVYVRDIDTLFYETACGSGTTALGQILALKEGKSITDIPIIQPSGQIIKISVSLGNTGFCFAQISGPIEKIAEGTLLKDSQSESFVIDKVETKEQLNNALYDERVIALYQTVFAGAPYFEAFSPSEVESFFYDYFEKGMILLARVSEGIIGFSASVPLLTEHKIVDILRDLDINLDNCAYISELGVSNPKRRRRVGQKLIEELMLRIPQKVAVLRTTENNHPAINLYQGLGFSIIPGIGQGVTQLRVDRSDLIDNRIFLIKPL